MAAEEMRKQCEYSIAIVYIQSLDISKTLMINRPQDIFTESSVARSVDAFAEQPYQC
jgi:hypothetical protein